MSATHTDPNTLVSPESLEDLATDPPPPSAPNSSPVGSYRSDTSFELPVGIYPSDYSSDRSAASERVEQPPTPQAPCTPPGSVVPDDLEVTPHKVTVALTRANPDDPAYRVQVAEETSDPMGGRPFDSWLELCLPGKDLDLSNLPSEFAKKKFDFNALIFDNGKRGHIEYEEEMYPKIVRL